MKPRRTKKVASAIKREIASALLLESGNPALRSAVITRVEVTSDLQTAYIYYTASTAEQIDKKSLQQYMNKSAGYFGGLLRNRLSLKRFLKVVFQYDSSAEEVENIEKILREVSSKVDKLK